MAQRAEPIVSVAEVPRGEAAHAPSCWLSAAIVIELSAAARTGTPNAAMKAIAPASSTARRLTTGMGNFTDSKLHLDGGTNGAHLAAWVKRKQTPGLVRRGPVDRAPNVSAVPPRKSPGDHGFRDGPVTASGRSVPTGI